MKDANYFAEIACREMTGDEQVKFRPLIYNLFLQAQAEAFNHAANVAAEELQQQARAICPGFREPFVYPMADIASTEKAKSDTLVCPPDGGCPPPAA